MSVVANGARSSGIACLMILAHIFGAAPSIADAKEELLLSRDGEHFTGDLGSPVFEEAEVLVPGASVSQAIWVRNGSQDPATLSISSLTGGQAQPQLTQYLLLRFTTDEVDTGWISLVDPDGVAPILEGLQLSPGEQLRLEVALQLSDQAPNETRRQHASFDFRFFLKGDHVEDASDTVGAGPEPVDSSGVSAGEQGKGSLASTGAGNVGLLALLGAAVLSAGFIVAAVARKRKDTGDE